MKIIGVTGTLSAGKGAIVEFFIQKGFVHFSARTFIIEEVEKRGLPVNRDMTTLVANDLREKHGPGYIIECLYANAKKSGKNSIIESIRAVGELDFLRKQEDFVLIAVDADPHIRYERAMNRKSALDNVTFEKFLSDENREMGQSDPTKGNIRECMKRADFTFTNDGTKEEFFKELDKALPKIIKK